MPSQMPISFYLEGEKWSASAETWGEDVSNTKLGGG